MYVGSDSGGKRCQCPTKYCSDSNTCTNRRIPIDRRRSLCNCLGIQYCPWSCNSKRLRDCMCNSCLVFPCASRRMLNEADYEAPRLEKEPTGLEMGFAPGRIYGGGVGSFRPDRTTPHVWLLKREEICLLKTKKQPCS